MGFFLLKWNTITLLSYFALDNFKFILIISKNKKVYFDIIIFIINYILLEKFKFINNLK